MKTLLDKGFAYTSADDTNITKTFKRIQGVPSMESELDALDALRAQHEQLVRKNGRLEMAQKIADWANTNRDRLPQAIREELASLLIKEFE